MQKVRVLLVEDDPMWQTELAYDLRRENDIELVAVVSTKETAVKATKELSIDVVLMDINLTEHHLDGIEATLEISKLKKDVKIIILTAFTEREIIVKALEYGAHNFINKSSVNDIMTAIRQAYTGEISLHKDATGPILREIQLKSLTPTERRVVDFREQGYTRKQIAEQFHTTMETIRTHIKNISKKLNHR